MIFCAGREVKAFVAQQKYFVRISLKFLALKVWFPTKNKKVMKPKTFTKQTHTGETKANQTVQG